MLQLCLHSLCGTKGPCHICHDWCGCRRIVRAYLHEALVGGPTRAGRFVLQLFVLHTPWQCACQTGTLQQHNCFLCGEISLHCWGWFTSSPGPSGHYSQHIPFAITRHLQATSQLCLGEITLRQTSQEDIFHVCVSLVSFWIANDKWCSKAKSYQHTWQWRALEKKRQ